MRFMKKRNMLKIVAGVIVFSLFAIGTYNPALLNILGCAVGFTIPLLMVLGSR